MRAAWISDVETPATAADLEAEGIQLEPFEAGAHEDAAERVAAAKGLTHATDVQRLPSNPRDVSAVAKEADEHAHLGEEVRVIVEGEVLYDVLGSDGRRWLRLWLGPGETLSIPAKRYHRMLASPQQPSLRYIEIFSDNTSLMPLYRVSDDATRAV